MSVKTARQAAEAIIRKLHAAGFEALLAGGCVRDLLIGREPADYDVATSARPEEVCRLYPRAQKVGAHFGVVLVRQFNHPVEVATFRKDGPYADGRHPDEVVFCTAREDAQRRDFTINGMFYDVLAGQAIDYVGGREDLEARIIRAIGNPEQRFEEDHLRLLRAVRFAARLGFHIEQETFEAIYNRADRIRQISTERVRGELEMILTEPNRGEGFDLLCATGLLLHLWPGSQWSTGTVKKSARALAGLPAESGFSLALAAMIYHHKPADASRICRDLTCSNKVREEVVWLLKGLSAASTGHIRTLADLKLLMANPCFPDLLYLFTSHLSAEDLPPSPADQLRARAEAIPRHEVAPAPLVGGDDLLQMGLPQGPAFKQILDELYYQQLNLELKAREEALAAAQLLVATPK